MQPRQSQILPEGDRILPMQQEDLAAVYQLECASQSEPWTLQHFSDELASGVSRVDLYRCRHELAGFLCTWLIAGELQIQNLATLPQFRRRGIAVSLLEHAIERSRKEGLSSIWLEVRVSNHPAIKLYERFGFFTNGIRSSYYPDGEDALIMTYQV